MTSSTSAAKSGASRTNGGKSAGPKTARGKQRAAQNSVKDGIFSRGIVIPTLDEKEADFNKIKAEFWKTLHPVGSLEETLVIDFVENWWRRERIRRAEHLELSARLGIANISDKVARAGKIQKLKGEFLLLCESLTQDTALDARTRTQLIEKLENLRLELASSSDGVLFLRRQVRNLQSSVDRGLALNEKQIVTLRACCGLASEVTLAVLEINSGLNQSTKSASPDSTGALQFERLTEKEKEVLRIAAALKYESGKLKAERGQNLVPVESPSLTVKDLPEPQQSADGTLKEQAREEGRGETLKSLSEVLSIAISQLESRGGEAALLERADQITRMATAIVEPDIADRFSRAETTAERRMYRALAALYASREYDRSTPLLEAPNAIRQRPETTSRGKYFKTNLSGGFSKY
jgi:hypothetical protein